MDANRCIDPTHRSYGSDKLWDECQYLAHAEAELGVKRTFPMKVARGSAVDEAIMALLREAPPVDLAEALRRYAREYGCGAPTDKDIEAGVAQVALFEREVLPTLPPIWAVQYEGHYELEGVTYHYHPDLIFTTGAVWDVKAPDQRLGEGRADYDVQLTGYTFGLWTEYGNLAPDVGLIGLVNGKMPEDVAYLLGIPDKGRTKPWLDRQLSTRTVEQLEAFADDLRRRRDAQAHAAESGVYQTQGRSSPYACNGCAAKALCPAWRGWDVGKHVVTNQEAA